jgi:hypothetical protein
MLQAALAVHTLTLSMDTAQIQAVQATEQAVVEHTAAQLLQQAE